MMAQQIINIGTSAGAGDGDDLRTSFDKVNQNFSELYSSNVAANSAPTVYSVAGRQGNVTLTWQDVAGVATTGSVTGLQANINAALVQALAYTNTAVASATTLTSTTIVNGNLYNARLTGSSWGTLSNLSVVNDLTANNLISTAGLVVAGPSLLHDISVTQITFADNTTMTTRVNLVPLTSNVSVLQSNVGTLASRINVANAYAYSVQAGLDQANSSIITLTANAAVQAGQISLLNANVSGANAAIANGYTRVAAANLALASTDANVAAANAAISAVTTAWVSNAGTQATLITALQGNAGTQQTQINAINANVTAANALIQGLGGVNLTVINANVAAANAAIALVNANVSAANSAISALQANAVSQQVWISSLDANAAAQALSLNVLTANAGSQSTLITALQGNAGTQQTEIIGLRANIEAANVAINSVGTGNIPGINANVTAANAAIAALRANITAANSTIAAKAPISSPTFTGTATIPTLSVLGNAAVGNISGTLASFQNLIGTVLTPSQPNITNLGTLTGLSVNGNISGIWITASQLVGPLRTGAQPNITSVGTLTSLAVTGNVTTGNVSGTNGVFGNVQGQLVTGSQPFIRQIGTLNSLDVTGNISAGNLTLAGNLALTNLGATRVTASTLSGTLQTPSQTNITTVGTLGNLAVTNAITAGGNITGANIAGTVVTSSQPKITLLGNLLSLDVGGDLYVYGNINTTGASNFSVGNILGQRFTANTVTANLITGTLVTGAQPNITSFGTLTGITVNGTGTFSAVNVTNNITATRLNGNILGTTGRFTGQLDTDSLYANAITSYGNVTGGNINVTTAVIVSAVGGKVRAEQGVFGNLLGTLYTSDQPYVTSLGTLTGLTVVGPVNITGTSTVSENLYVAGNLYIAGNTTTVGAANVTTADKDITLANGAVSSAAAAGAGILIGQGGQYGSFVINNGTWFTPNALTVTGNLSGGNVSGTNGTFTAIDGTLNTATQPNITSVGTLTSLTVSGSITGTLATASQTNITAVGTLGTLAVTGNATTGNVSGTTGAFTNVTGTLQTASQPNITTVGTLDALTVTGNVAAGNVSGATGAFTNVSGTVLTASQPNITTVGNLGNLVVTGTATLGAIQLTGAASTLNVVNLAATGNVSSGNVTATGTGSFANISGNVVTASQPFITSLGNLTSLTVTGNATTGNVSGTTGVFNDVVGQQAHIVGNATTGNVSGTTGSFANISGNVVTASQPFITSLGNLSALTVSGNATVGNISGASATFTTVSATTITGLVNAAYSGNLDVGNLNASSGTGVFANISGNVVQAAQPFITSVGTLASVNVSGNATVGNVNTNIVVANLITGVITTSSQPNITSIGTLDSLTVSGSITGNVVATLVQGYLTTATQPNITGVGSLSQLTVIGNVGAQAVNATNGKFAEIEGVVLNNVQPYITSIGTLTTMNVSGNIVAQSSLNANSIHITNQVVATRAELQSANISSVNATVANVSNIAYLSNVTTANLTTTNTLVVNNQSSFGGLITASAMSMSGNLISTGANITATNANLQVASQSVTGTAWLNTAVLAGALSVAATASAGNLSTTGNTTVGQSLIVTGASRLNANTTIFSNLTMTGSGFTGIYANVANVVLFPSTVTTMVIGSEATTVNIGSVNGLGNTTILNSLTVVGGLFLSNGWGLAGAGNVTVNNDLAVTNASFANIVYANTRAILGNAGPVTARSTSFDTGALQVRGGVGIMGNVVIGVPGRGNANVYINSTTSAVGANTGALQVTGGISTRGNLWIGGDAFITGNVNFQAFLAASINSTPIGNATPASGVFTTIGLSQQRPNRRPVFNFDFANAQKLDGAIVYSRTGPGSYYDQRGNLRIAGAHVPRFTHDPLSRRPLGLLIEESRQNLQVQSNSFANATAWGTALASISAVSNIDAPTGVYGDAFKLIEDSSNDIHQVFPVIQPTATLSATYTASIFAKRAERDQISLIIAGEGPATVFDLTNGTFTEGTYYSSSMKLLANGWYRLQSTVSKTNTSGNVSIALGAGSSYTYAGDGTSGVYIYGYQFEPGEFATSYIHNGITANTRGADTVSVRSSEFAKRYNADEGPSFLADACLDYTPSSLVPTNTRSTVVSFNDGTVANRISLVVENRAAPVDRTANLVVYTGGILNTNANVASANLTTLDSGKVSAYARYGSYGLAYNGLYSSVQNGGTIPMNGAITTLNIGSGPGTRSLNGTISKLMIFESNLSGIEMQSLTNNQ